MATAKIASLDTILPTLTHLRPCVVFYGKTLDEEKFPLNYMEIFQKVFDMRFLKLGLLSHRKQISARYPRAGSACQCRHPGAATASHHTLGLVTHRLVPPLSGVQRAKIQGATGLAPSSGEGPFCLSQLLGPRHPWLGAMSPSVLAVPAPQTSLLKGCLSLELSHPSPGCLLWRAHLQRPNCMQVTFTG